MTESAWLPYRALQKLARSQDRPAGELMLLYALEGFLARLATSEHRDVFVLKEGMLLAALDTRRPTRDIDVQALDFPNETRQAVAAVRDVLRITMNDGLAFDVDNVTAVEIRQDDDYHGVRVSVSAQLATADLKFRLDISVGDPIVPDPVRVRIPRLLDDEPIWMHGFPLPMVLAEKGITAIERGTANTRWRDFADLFLLSQRHEVNGDELGESLRTVASYRRTRLVTLASQLDGFAEHGQLRWERWLAKNRLEDRLPGSFGEVLAKIQRFIDPALSGQLGSLRWDPHTSVWR